MARTGYYYPRIAYNSINIDFSDVANTPIGPCNIIMIGEQALRGENVSVDGHREVLYQRDEVGVRLGWTILDKAMLETLFTYWTNWGKLGKQAAITLDRLSTCGGQYEYDHFNTYFTKAECVDAQFPVQRSTLGKQFFAIALNFRQGQ